MVTIIKSFVGCFFLLLLVYLGIGISSASIDARNAERSASSYASRISCSNYSSQVVEDCKADAMQEGYELKVQLMKPRDREYSTYGSLELIYHYRIPILNMNQEQCIYADIL